jgi:error-prone DNA polymerase
MNTRLDEKEFAELHCYSNFTFLKAASHPEELVRTAHQQGYSALAITDECSLAGVVRAWREVQTLQDSPASPLNTHKQQSPLKLIIGASFHFKDHVFVLLAPTLAAYKELSVFISHCRRRANKGEYVFEPNDIHQHIRHCFLLIKSGNNAYELDDFFSKLFKDSTNHKNLNCHVLLELELSKQDTPALQTAHKLAAQYQLPLLASGGPRMHSRQQKPLLDVLTAIDFNTSIQQLATLCPPVLLFNSERFLRPIKALHKLYPTHSIENALHLAQQCTFKLDEISYQYPKDTVPDDHSPQFYLRQQTWQGAHRRYPQGIPKKVKRDIKKELKLISEVQYEYYFLTVYDITQFAKRQNILHQGRGSAANSAVCYCLGITEVNPNNINLLFERFISKRRNEPPDIDVDFDNSRREEVIQYLYEKYGRKRCAIAATVITYRPKSAVRDVGKALGLDLTQLETVINKYGWRYLGENWIDQIIGEELCQNHDLIHHYKNIITQILGFPRHLSQHVGGFILSQEPLNELVPIENATMEDRTVIQWDKNDLETMRLMKVDVLALGMLAAVQKCLDDLSTLSNKMFYLQDIPQWDDPKVYKMLQSAQSVGLFQVESRAQMNMLPRLHPTTFYDLVVQVAIVRPGPIHGDMVHPYLKRKHGLEKVDVPLKSMEPILARTFGVPIFQEQVIALAMMAADFSGDEAEQLRRSMASWKKRGHMHFLQKKLHDNLLNQGVEEEYITRLNRQIEGFGEYGFPESHAASFALIVYYSAWLKCYHPAIFFCALLNSQPMGFYQPWQLIQDAKQHGVKFLECNINDSQWDHKVLGLNDKSASISNSPNTVQLGFCLVKGLKKDNIQTLINNRPNQGFQSISQVLNSSPLTPSPLNKHDIQVLSAAHCFKCFNENRYENRWQSQAKDYYAGLFSQQKTDSDNDALHTSPSRIDNIIEDYNATGVLLNDHPMDYLRDHPVMQDCIKAQDLIHMKHKHEGYVAGLVISRQRPKTSAGVTFVTLEDESGSINLVVWLDQATRQLKELTQSRMLKVYGCVDKDPSSKVVHFIAYRLFDISEELNQWKNPSRDFH